MRRSTVALAVILALISVSAAAIPLCNYQSPLTNLSNLVVSFAYQYHNDPYGLEDRDVSSGEFSVDFRRLYDTPEYGYDVDLTNEMVISVFDVSSYSTIADASYKRYLAEEEDLFAFAGGSVRSSSSFSSIGMSVNVGLGTGRFTDVTPLAKATRIDDYLVARGSLTEPLHAVDLQIMAHEIGSRASYESLADLLTVVQEIIEDSGRVRSGGLDALDISEITRLIQDESFTRYCGWDAKIGLGYELLDPSGGANDLLVIGAFNYAFATTPQAQFLIQGTISGPPTLLETNRIDVTAEYDYLISGFLNLEATYDFSRETWIGEPTDIHRFAVNFVMQPLPSADVVLGMVFEHRPYFLEWNVDVKLSISMDLL